MKENVKDLTKNQKLTIKTSNKFNNYA